MAELTIRGQDLLDVPQAVRAARRAWRRLRGRDYQKTGSPSRRSRAAAQGGPAPARRPAHARAARRRVGLTPRTRSPTTRSSRSCRAPEALQRPIAVRGDRALLGAGRARARAARLTLIHRSSRVPPRRTPRSGKRRVLHWAWHLHAGQVRPARREDFAPWPGCSPALIRRSGHGVVLPEPARRMTHAAASSRSACASSPTSSSLHAPDHSGAALWRCTGIGARICASRSCSCELRLLPRIVRSTRAGGRSSNASRRPHYYLSVIGNDTHRQGAGRRIRPARSGLERCDAKRTAAYLESPRRAISRSSPSRFELTSASTARRGACAVAHVARAAAWRPRKAGRGLLTMSAPCVAAHADRAQPSAAPCGLRYWTGVSPSDPSRSRPPSRR